MVNDNLGSALLRAAVHAALAGGALVATIGAAQAQQTTPAPDASAPQLQEVVVTGSRIAVPNDESISPVTFVSAAQIQETGITRVEDLLNQLPQVFASQGSNVVNGSTGTATVNLRGLNAKRTLVLVDGKRLGPGDPAAGGASDVNMIPDALISSVEVLTGGASSVYGADAVAGVVNFKLDTHFEGVKLVYNGGFYNHSNRDTSGVQDAISTFNTTYGTDFAQAPSSVNPGTQQEISFIAGLNSPDGKGNATFYATYRKVQAVLQSKYSVSACSLNSGHTGGSYDTGGKFACGGSSTNPYGRFLYFGTPSSDTTLGPNNTLIPYAGSGHLFNYGPLNYFQRPDERYTAGAFLHYDFNEHAKVYASTMFMDDRTVAQIAPSGDFGNTSSVNCANPFLTTGELGAWCGGSTAGTANGLYILRRNVEGGDRQDDLEHTDFREVVGMKGDVNDVWSYDASYLFSLANLSETYYNDVSIRKLQNALDVVNVNGVPTCQSVVNGTDLQCVPWNVFQLGGVTPAAANYLATPGLQRGQIKQQIVDVNFTGDFGKYGVQLPHTTSGLKVNVGVEWRDLSSFFEPDQEFQSGDLAGQGGATLPVGGGIISREAFMEARIPLLDNMTGAKAVDLDTGYRYSSYSQGFKTNTFKLGIDWKPVESVRLRGSFARAVRAPNIGELYSVQSVALDGNTDPCSGTTPTYSATQCALTGVSAAQYGHIVPNPANQYNGFQGGSPSLQPETALTSSFGIGWTPTFLPNFRAQIDYYDIKIENVIQTIGADSILTDCATSGQFCSLIHRAPTTGSLWLTPSGFVTDTLQNVGQLEEKGIDVDMAYSYDIGRFGRLHVSLVGTYLDAYNITSIQSAPSTEYNCVGYYGVKCSSFTAGAGGPVFRWRHQLRFAWMTPWRGLDVAMTWRYFAPVSLEQLSSNPNITAPAGATIANGGISNTDAHLSSYSYIDLTGAMHVGDYTTVRLGVNNLFDKDPPVIGSSDLPSVSGNGNTFPQIYDSLGRYIFGEVTVQF